VKPVPNRKKDFAKLYTSTNYDWLKMWKLDLSDKVESEDTDCEAGEKPVMYMVQGSHGCSEDHQEEGIVVSYCVHC